MRIKICLENTGLVFLIPWKLLWVTQPDPSLWIPPKISPDVSTPLTPDRQVIGRCLVFPWEKLMTVAHWGCVHAVWSMTLGLLHMWLWSILPHANPLWSSHSKYKLLCTLLKHWVSLHSVLSLHPPWLCWRPHKPASPIQAISAWLYPASPYSSPSSWSSTCCLGLKSAQILPPGVFK